MTVRNHISQFCLVTTLWTFFFLGGLWSNYYQDWHWTWQLLIIDCLPVAILTYRAPAMIKISGGKSPRQTAILLAFYFSVPFLIYDFIYLRLFKELPLFYLIDYWYLTIFSAPPWMIFPAVTSRIEARKV